MTSNYNMLTDKIIQFNDVFEDMNKVVTQVNSGSWEHWGRANNERIGSLRWIYNNEDYLYKAINEAVAKSVKEYFSNQSILEDKYSFSNSSYHIRKWDSPMRGMEPHSDFSANGDGSRSNPSYTICGYITDDYEGGHLEFPNHNISFKPPAGSIIIFPSDEWHGVSYVISGNRMMFSLFIHELTH
jgi:hypothetical protein